MRTETTAKLRDGGEKSAAELVRGDVVVVEAGEGIPGDGTVIEGIASVDESAITGESAPVIREAGGDRSRRHRRHQGALRPDRRRDHPGARQVLPRPHDRPGRGRRAAQDAERDRARHPARGADPDLPHRRRLAAPVRALRRHRTLGDDADRAARGADPDHDRGAALGDRDRRHGPPRAPQRARPLRPRGRGLRRLRRAAARQDRHDHARQPRGDRVHRRCRASASEELAEAAQMSSLADETPEGRSIVVLAKELRHPRARLRRPRAELRPVHRRRRG